MLSFSAVLSRTVDMDPSRTGIYARRSALTKLQNVKVLAIRCPL